MKKDKRILIVDRDTDFVNELTNYLLAAGYRNIESLDSYTSALTRMKQNHFDIVLMDIFTSNTKGLDYIQEIKCLQPEVKIFLMTEPKHQKLVDEKLLREVKFKCVLKPFIKQNLLESIQ